MLKINDKKKKYMTFILFFTVLLCSFLGIEYDTVYENMPASMGEVSHVSINDFESVLDEFISSKEISVSTSEAAIAQQLSTRRNSVSTFGSGFLVALLPLALGLLFLACMLFCCNSTSCSQRYIIRYIHNKDGQKA